MAGDNGTDRWWWGLRSGGRPARGDAEECNEGGDEIVVVVRSGVWLTDLAIELESVAA